VSEPWGHKITVSIYVPGDEIKAENVADGIMVPGYATFAGVVIEPVQNEPQDQVAT
jgi:hypothetical protein